MPSSISNSDPRRGIAWLLVGCLLVALAVEVTARAGFHRASRIQRRFIDEYRSAQRIGVSRAGKHTVLVVGNSLLLEGVMFDQLKQTLASHDWDAYRLTLERTFYYDWYYALRELYRAGARPDAVVAMLGPRQWIQREIRGEFSAHYLMNGRDVLRVSRELGLNATETTNLLAARTSGFWAVRAELRNFLLPFFIRDVTRLVDRFTRTGPQPLSAVEVEQAAVDRVARLRELTASHGASLALLLPPTLVRGQEGDAWIGLMHAADANTVPFLKPFDASTFGPDMFRDDGFHLNPKGAARYTALLAPALSRALAMQFATQQSTGIARFQQ